MRRFILVLLWCWPGLALGAIGDPCPEGDECAPGEVCLDHVEGAYCTTRCPAGGCPEGYGCDGEGRVRVCVRGADQPPPEPAAMGEDCSERPCEPTLFCATDGELKYCSRPCWGPGTCPDGFRCTGGGAPACARLNGAPGNAEPCSPDGACAEGLVCVDANTRDRPLCTTACEAAAMCRQAWVCQNGHCLPGERLRRPGLGEACSDDAAEPSAAGCRDGLECHLAGRQLSYCTQGQCDSLNRCPEGFGCIEVAPGTGACRQGVADDVVFTPPPDIDVPVLPPPPSDAGPSTAPPPSGAGGGGGAPSDAGGDDGGCSIGAQGGTGPLWLFVVVVLCRRRR